MIRVHLTAEDLVCTRLAPTHGPASEVLFAAAWSARRRAHPALDHWKATIRPRPSKWAATVRALVHAGRAGHPPVDVFTLMGASPDTGDALDRLAHQPAATVYEELADAVGVWRRENVPVPPQLSELVRSTHLDSRPGQSLAAAIGDAFDEVLRPVWPRTRSYLIDQHRRRSLALAEHGVDGLLHRLHPSIRWNPPVLSFPTSGPRSVDLRPGGRGLLLAPSLFLTPLPLAYQPARSTTGQLTIFFPAVPEAMDAARIWADPHGIAGRGLGQLLGRTRAAVLEALQRECSTTQLARRISASPATASEHASVLRAAGLVDTRRDGGAVLHSLTELGCALLNGS